MACLFAPTSTSLGRRSLPLRWRIFCKFRPFSAVRLICWWLLQRPGGASISKRHSSLPSWDMKNCLEKVRQSGNDNVMLCERGTSFGYNTLVVDMTGLRVMKDFGVPVIFDATHSVQKPGGNGTSTGGNREYVEYLAKAAVAVGVDGLFMETHPDPDHAKSDGPNMVPLNEMETLLKKLILVYNAVHTEI